MGDQSSLCLCLTVGLIVCIYVLSNDNGLSNKHTKPDGHILHGGPLACTDPEVRRSKVKVMELSNALLAGQYDLPGYLSYT